MYICPFLQDLSQGNPHSPWVVSPSAPSLWRTGSSVGLTATICNPTGGVPAQTSTSAPHSMGLPGDKKYGQQVKDNHFYITHFCPSFFSLLSVGKWVISAFLVMKSKCCLWQENVPSCRKIWGLKISSIAHYTCVNPLFYVFHSFLEEKETWQ